MDEKNSFVKNGLVSVVLSIYNVENYLSRSISSIVNQTYSNLEIILVNDGSTDQSGKICAEWAKKDSRIIVIDKENEGLGMARNTGLERASGEYIFFFDSDDYVRADMVDSLYREAQNRNADIVIYGFYNVSSDGNIVDSVVPGKDTKIFSGEEVTEKLLPDMIAKDPNGKDTPDYWMSAWASMYKTEVLKNNNLRFISERQIISEDIYSLLSFYRYMHIVVVLPEPFYYYCQNTASLTRKYRSDRYKKIRHFYLESLKLCKKLNYNDDVIYRLQMPFFYFTVSALKQEVKYGTYHGLKEIVRDETLQDVVGRIRGDSNTVQRKILLAVIYRRMYRLCYLLLKVKL